MSEATLRGLLRTVPRQPVPPLPVVRYERATPGERPHLDIKKLGRIATVGLRIAGDPRDHTRVAFAEVRPDECKETGVAFLMAAVANFALLVVSAQRVTTDNGSCYRSSPSGKPAKNSASSTSAPAPIHQKLTAKPSS